MAKIKLVVSATIEETFSDFIISKKTKGLAEKTLQSYQSQFQAAARHMDVKMDIAMLQNLPICLPMFQKIQSKTNLLRRELFLLVSLKLLFDANKMIMVYKRLHQFYLYDYIVQPADRNILIYN